jgi:hypothetical protein
MRFLVRCLGESDVPSTSRGNIVPKPFRDLLAKSGDCFPKEHRGDVWLGEHPAIAMTKQMDFFNPLMYGNCRLDVVIKSQLHYEKGSRAPAGITTSRHPSNSSWVSGCAQGFQ